MAERTDARGVVLRYTYDDRDRLAATAPRFGHLRPGAGLGRSCFENGEVQRGYAALGDAMQCALERGLDPRVVADLIQIGLFADPRLAPDTFVSALRKYAVTHAGLQETEFSTLWARAPDEALRRLLNEGTTTPDGRDVET